MYNGYEFYFKDGGTVLTFPITPPSLSIKVGSNNKVITLINEGDINILKSPSLTEVEFEARFPMRQYPYARQYSDFQSYYDIFQSLKESKRPFRFIVTRRSAGGGKKTWDTNLLVAIEDMTFDEDADEGDDVLVSFTLKQYKSYGVQTLKVATNAPTTTSTSETPRSSDDHNTTASTARTSGISFILQLRNIQVSRFGIWNC